MRYHEDHRSATSKFPNFPKLPYRGAVCCVGRIVRLGGRRVDHAVGGAWHTVVRTDTGESYVMGCIWPAGGQHIVRKTPLETFI